MAKLTLSDITSGYASTTALNDNFALIETALENTLSRDGTTPNQMQSNLDMNGYAVLNARATSGNENFLWMGTWATGTTYAVNNLVYAPEGEEEGNTLICVTAHTAGATLDGDADKWAMFAQRGAPGASGGDVVGPASSTADSLARFNGTTGKLLKNGAVIGKDVQAYNANLAALTSFTTDTDGTLTANSDVRLATQKAVKTYADNLVSLAIAASPDAGADYFIFEDATDNTQKKALINTIQPATAKVSSNDTTPGYLNGKLVAGTNITFTENNNGANETLTIAASGGVPTDVSYGTSAAVGTIAMMMNNGGSLSAGETVSGATLRWSLVLSGSIGVGNTASGTWRNVTGNTISNTDHGTFQRIA